MSLQANPHFHRIRWNNTPLSTAKTVPPPRRGTPVKLESRAEVKWWKSHWSDHTGQACSRGLCVDGKQYPHCPWCKYSTAKCHFVTSESVSCEQTNTHKSRSSDILSLYVYTYAEFLIHTWAHWKNRFDIVILTMLFSTMCISVNFVGLVDKKFTNVA